MLFNDWQKRRGREGLFTFAGEEDASGSDDGHGSGDGDKVVRAGVRVLLGTAVGGFAVGAEVRVNHGIGDLFVGQHKAAQLFGLDLDQLLSESRVKSTSVSLPFR